MHSLGAIELRQCTRLVLGGGPARRQDRVYPGLDGVRTCFSHFRRMRCPRVEVIAAQLPPEQHAEVEAEALGQQERKFQGQLPQVKKNEEYQALLHEIGSTKQQRSELETRILMTLEEEERIAAERKAIEGALATAEREMRERVAAIEAEEREEHARLEVLEQRRTAELDGLSVTARARYQRIHSSRQGRAVVPIDKNACGGCYRALPPQILQEARRRDRILNCEGCGRLVILPPDSP